MRIRPIYARAPRTPWAGHLGGCDSSPLRAVLMNHRGELLVDANRQQLKAGATVVDDMFGEGIVRGTVHNRTWTSTFASIGLLGLAPWRVAPAISQSGRSLATWQDYRPHHPPPLCTRPASTTASFGRTSTRDPPSSKSTTTLDTYGMHSADNSWVVVNRDSCALASLHFR